MIEWFIYGVICALIGLVIGYLLSVMHAWKQRETGPLAVDWDEVLQEVQAC
jgi:hypothetical protein